MRPQLSKIQSSDLQLNIAINRALFAKDVEEIFTLLSDWMEENHLTAPSNFSLPKYLEKQLCRGMIKS